MAEDLPSVTTDLEDYPPGATAIITGENFDSGETIELQVLHTDGIPNTGGGHDPWFVTDGGLGDLDGIVDGDFETTWYVNPDDSANSAFELTATGLTSEQIATHHFTDSGADFSIDFAAAAPQIYDHDTGGGAFEDKTINTDAVESLEGGDFAVGDIVSYYFNVNTAANAVDQFPQTIDIDVSFLVNTTGQTGVSHRDIVGVSANYYTGELTDYNDPTSGVNIISDLGVIDDDSTTAWIVPGTKIYENKVTGETYSTYTQAADEQGAVVSATVRLNDLEPGERVVLRVDTLLDAIPGSTPTGNLQGFVTGARVVSPTDDPIINIGNQTIPFKLTPEISGIPELAPGLTVEKVVTTDLDLSGSTISQTDYDNHTSPSVDANAYFDSIKNNESVTVLEGSTVRYIYRIENTGNVITSLLNLVDDNGTSGDTSPATDDDVYIFYGQEGQNKPILWNRLADGAQNDPGTNLVTNPPTTNGDLQVLGSGFLNDNVSSNSVLSTIQDLDGSVQPLGTSQVGDNDTHSLRPGDSVYVYYDVNIIDSDRDSLGSLTNTATVSAVVDPNGGGQQGNPVTDTDTANVDILPTNAGTASLSGYSYLDLNNDGIKDPGESAVVGALITLSNGATTRTDMNGFYIFNNLADGTYTITQTQPLNYYDGKEAENNVPFESGNNQISVAVSAGNYYENNNFGELLPADISGVAYYDLDGDQDRQDTETGRAGIQVTLSGTNDLGETVNETTTTDSSGRYYFGNLRPSDFDNNRSYTISFPTDPGNVGTGDVGQILGTNLGNNSGNGGTDQITDIFLGAGSSGVNYDYGIPTSAVGGIISGTVYQDTGIYSGGSLTGADNGEINDTDSNSFSTTPSTGEKRIAGVTINLTGTTDLGAFVSKTTKTDINGNYSFTDLENGTYQVVETQPQYFDPSAKQGDGGLVNYLDGKEDSPTGDATTTNDQISGLVIDDSTPNPTTNLTGNNFGELPPASISGYVFLDTKKGRIYGLDNGETMTVDGQTYQPSGNSFENVTIPVRNGEFDDDEYGISGVTIQLTGTDYQGNPIDSDPNTDGNQPIVTTTDPNGYYRFDGLASGNYIVTQVQPSSYVDGTYDANSDKTFTASDVNTGNVLGTSNGTYNDPQEANPASTAEDNFSGIDLNFGESGVDYNFPEATDNAIISGNVYFDTDGDSTTSGDQTGLSGITINLLELDALDGNVINTTTTTTRADGSYQFTDVTAGFYSIEQIDTGGAYTDASPAVSIPGSNGTSSPNASGIDDRITNITVGAGDQLTDYNFYETSLNGTNSSETLSGGAGDDFIIGYRGQDTLTGGGGNDTFFYNETSEGVDVITDFTSGSDKIDISEILANETTYTTGNPFDLNQGYAIVTDYPAALGGGAMVQIDFDGAGPNSLVKSVVLIKNLTAADVDTDGTSSADTDFIF